MPFGYLVSTVIAAIAPALALWPRATRGPRASPAFVVESVANELPLPILYWLVATTLLAVAQGNIDTPVGWLGLAIAIAAAVAVGAVVQRARAARPALDAAFAAALGRDWLGGLAPTRPERTRRTVQILIAPLRITPRTVRRARNVSYGPAGRANLLDLYRDRAPTGPSPVLIYFHPGGFFSGRKSREARPLIDRLVADGWLCISANYRLRRDGQFPDPLVDAKRVIAWVRSHADEIGADRDTVFVAGGSAGAHLAAMCALTPNDATLQPGFESADTSVAAAITLYGFYGSASNAAGTQSSPRDVVHAGAPPFLVIHGDRDPMTHVDGAREFVAALRT
ncbi:MAG TPA: alpha/beta hydrolase, partial [Acidimicrobiia bacterium]